MPAARGSNFARIHCYSFLACGSLLAACSVAHSPPKNTIDKRAESIVSRNGIATAQETLKTTTENKMLGHHARGAAEASSDLHKETVPPINVGALPNCDATRELPPQRMRVRRLSNTQLNNAIRSLGISFEPRLPAPAVSDSGFDTAPESLSSGPLFQAAMETAAEELATLYVPVLKAQMSCLTLGSLQESCADSLLNHIVDKVWRSAPSSESKASLRALATKLSTTHSGDTLVRTLLKAAFRSPRFTSLVDASPSSGTDARSALEKSRERANVLAFTLTDAPPDTTLLSLAERGLLVDASVYRTQARRLAESAQGRRKFAEFIIQWVGAKPEEGAFPRKDPNVFPDYNQSIHSLMMQETKLLAEWLAFEQNGTLSDLLTTETTFLNDTLARYYGVNDVTSNVFVPISLAGGKRAGILTTGAFLTNMSGTTFNRPIHTAALMRMRMLCSPPPLPPSDAIEQAGQIPPAPPGTQRAMYDHFNANAPVSCATCHKAFVPLGLVLDSFGPDGRWRASERGFPIDTKMMVTIPGLQGNREVADPKALAAAIAVSPNYHRCFSSAAFRFHWGTQLTEKQACLTNNMWKGLSPESKLLDVYLESVVRFDLN